jgi:hypothetical protein
MCDYSLHAVASRPAKVGDKLITTRFPMSTTRGFAETGAPAVAVCLRPGTEVAFEEAVRYARTFDLEATIPQRVARFRQVNPHSPTQHHDALEFPGGETVLLTRLLSGQRATVLQLPKDETPEKRAESVSPSSAARTPSAMEDVS